MKRNKETKYIDLHIDAPIEDVQIILDKLIKEDEMKKIIEEFDKEVREITMTYGCQSGPKIQQLFRKALAEQEERLKWEHTLNKVKIGKELLATELAKQLDKVEEIVDKFGKQDDYGVYYIDVKELKSELDKLK